VQVVHEDAGARGGFKEGGGLNKKGEERGRSR
jgi:hypothetical protein